MSKYYKAEDVISFLNMNCPKDMWEYQIADLPTIEVSEDCDSCIWNSCNYNKVPWEISEDAISREYLKSFEYINKGDFNSIETIREWIDNAPSVVPQAKEGEWVEIGLATHSYKCSVCGRMLMNITDGKKNVAKNYPYCHCGARMKGKEKIKE